MPDRSISTFDDRRCGDGATQPTSGATTGSQVITFGTIKTKAALKDSARIHYGSPLATPTGITARYAGDHGQRYPAVWDHRSQPRTAPAPPSNRGLIETTRRTIYQTARG